MPFCPNCRSEYVAGKKICTDCGVPLVDKLEPEFTEQEDWEVVFTSAQDYEAEMVRSRLEEDGIPARVLSKADHALGINVGDLAVVQVLVHPDDVDDALAVVKQSDSIDPDSLGDLADEGADDF